MAWTAQVTDTLINFLSKLGTKADKSTAARYAMLGQLDQAQLEAAYRTDWIARKIVDIPPNDCTREWRQWQTDADDVTLIEDVEKVFKVQQKVKEAQVKARLFGGAAIIIGTDDGDMSKPLDVEKVKKDSLKFVHVVTRWEIQTGPIIQDLLDPDFGKPEYFAARRLVRRTKSASIPRACASSRVPSCRQRRYRPRRLTWRGAIARCRSLTTR
jgi:phage-related protein (TIGR01555 family)